MDAELQSHYLHALGVTVWRSRQSVAADVVQRQKGEPQALRHFYLQTMSGSVVELFISAEDVAPGSQSRELLAKMMQAAKLSWFKSTDAVDSAVVKLTMVLGEAQLFAALPALSQKDFSVGVLPVQHNNKVVMVSYAPSALLTNAALKKAAWQHLQAAMSSVDS